MHACRRVSWGRLRGRQPSWDSKAPSAVRRATLRTISASAECDRRPRSRAYRGAEGRVATLQLSQTNSTTATRPQLGNGKVQLTLTQNDLKNGRKIARKIRPSLSMFWLTHLWLSPGTREDGEDVKAEGSEHRKGGFDRRRGTTGMERLWVTASKGLGSRGLLTVSVG